MLYICATPIGNLGDITLRALTILAQADIILCEDTRVSRHLLNFHNIHSKQLITLNAHNENEVSSRIISQLQAGMVIVLISDAGTPGISDPGARLCNQVRAADLSISSLPGACAYTTLLSVSGLIDIPSLFYGFLPSQSGARAKVLSNWQGVNYAVCIYEAPHRIVACIEDVVACLGADRIVIMGRELTKQFETIKKLPAAKLLEFIKNDANQQRGEFVLLILPAASRDEVDAVLTPEQINTMQLLLKELPPKKAVSLTHKIVGGNKDLLYNYAIEHKS